MAFIIFPYLKVLLVSMEIYIKQDNFKILSFSLDNNVKSKLRIHYWATEIGEKNHSKWKQCKLLAHDNSSIW